MAKKSIMGALNNSKIGQVTKSVTDALIDSKVVTFDTVNKTATSGVNKYTSAINKRARDGDTKVLGGLFELENPSAENLLTGVKLNKKADAAIGVAIAGAFAGKSAFEGSNLYDEFQKHEAARSNEVNTNAPHSDLGMYDSGTTNASGIGYGPSAQRGRVYGSSRDYSLGATGDLTLGLHRARRRRS